MSEEFKMPEKDLNFLEFNLGERKLYIFKHHAVAIKCLKKAYSEKKLERDNLLIHIDNHADLQFLEKHFEDSKNIINMGKEKLDEFIQNLFFDNSEFIVPLFYSGIIENSISIHREEGSHSGELIKSISGSDPTHLLFNQDGKNHKCFLGGSSINHSFDSHDGILGDTCKNRKVIDLYKTREVILDIDLDYFTYFNNKTFAQNKRDIVSQLNSNPFQSLFNKSKIILIALEPKHCGGEEDCLEILDIFQDEIFSKYGLNVYNKVKEEFFNKNEN